MTKKNVLDLSTLRLKAGSHPSRKDGVCLMEAVAWFRGIKHTDAPPCVCPTLRGIGISLNDRLDEENRQKLVPMIPLVVGTADDGLAQRRGLMAMDWIIRTYTPAWLRLARLDDEASSLESLAEMTEWSHVQASLDALGRARKAAEAAYSAADSAAYSAARSAADSAADSAAYSAARSAVKPTADALTESAIALFKRMAELRPEKQEVA